MDDLFRARWAPSVRLAIALTSDRAVAEELVQEAFFEVSRRWADLDNAEAYLRTTVVNRCRSHHRRAGIARRRLVPERPGTVAAPELDELWHVLARLPERRRAALVLRYYEDLPVAEIARLLECKPGTVSSLLNRGLADLRKVLDHAG
jgi:RNA polymerase sigma factor (sigma-70 family)